MIIENENYLKIINNNNELFKEYGIIHLYNNNHIEIIPIKKTNHNSIIRIITLQSLKEEIEYLSPKPFNYFIQKGLNQKYNPKNTIAIILKNKFNEDLLKSYCFNNSNSEMKNDIPFYHSGIPDGFSMFCSQLEYLQLMAHLDKYGKKKKKIEEDEELETEPIPNKKHYVCQICKLKFGNYLEHIKSKLHNDNKLKYRNIFLKMKLTFRRIANWKESQNNKNINNNISKDSTKLEITELKHTEEQKDKNTSFTNSYIINNITTKEDSNVIINDENKDNNKNNIRKDIVEEDKDNNDKKEDISVKDILNILDSIDSKKKYNMCKPKKRKNNEKNKYFFHENYIFELQKITGKISYFSSINKLNK